MKTIAVIGHGYVGKAVEKFFNNHFNVLIYDPLYVGVANPEPDRPIDSAEHITYLNNEKDSVNKDAANQADFAVVCVPTPMGQDFVVDTSLVAGAVDWLTTPLILIKSTVPPGTVDTLIQNTNKHICFSPEFIGEGKYSVQYWLNYPHPTDMKLHSFHIVGGDQTDAYAILDFFKTVAGPGVVYHAVDAKTAEFIKYMENTWGAMKVTFCNEMALMAEAFGVEYDKMREGWLLDGRVEPMHTAVFKDKRGFSGKCFPKDLIGMIKAAEAINFNPKMLKEVWNRNLDFVLADPAAHGNPDWASMDNVQEVNSIS